MASPGGVLLVLLLVLLLEGVLRPVVPGALGQDSGEGSELKSWAAASHQHPQHTPSEEPAHSHGEGDEGSDSDDVTLGEHLGDADGRGAPEEKGEDAKMAESGSDSAPHSASSRMLLVGERAATPSNTTSAQNQLTWRLKNTNLLHELTNKIFGSDEDTENLDSNAGEEPVSTDGSAVRETGARSLVTSSQSEAASKVVETRVAAPGSFLDHDGGCDHKRSGKCLSPNETLKLRQQLQQDLETSFSAPLPSRIRYRLKKKPSIYTSKKSGGSRIHSMSGMPKNRRYSSRHRHTTASSDEVYGFAGDKKIQHYALPKSPAYVPLEALTTPAYSEGNTDTVTKPYIPLNRNHETDKSSLVFRPPRRPPGSQKRRTSGLLRRPTSGQPHYFTAAPERLSIQAHLQYRRPVSFKYSRASGSSHGETGTHSKPTTTPHHRASSSTASPAESYISPPQKYLPFHSSPTETTKDTGYTKSSDQYLSQMSPHQKLKTEYNPPAEDYTESPSKEYGTPESPDRVEGYTQPSEKYLPAHKEYVTSENVYEHPVKPETQPPQKYLPTNNEYLSPNAEHKPPSVSYVKPPREYLPPTREYGPPQGAHRVINQTDKLPVNYLQPNKEQVGPHRRPRPSGMSPKAPKGGYVVPSRNYLPPNKESGYNGRMPGRGRRPSQRPHRPGKGRRKKMRKRPTEPKPDAPARPGSPHGPAPPHPTKVPTLYKTPTSEYSPLKPNDPHSHLDLMSMTTATTASYTSPARTYFPPHRNYQTAIPTATSHHPTPSAEYGAPPTSVVHKVPPQSYQPPVNEYLPPKHDSHGAALPEWLADIQKGGHSPSTLEIKGYTSNPMSPGYQPPELLYNSPQPEGPNPGYSLAVSTNEPPFREYFPPDRHSLQSTVVPPVRNYITSSPQQMYSRPPPPPLHVPIDPTFLPPVKKPLAEYIPPKQDYSAPVNQDSPTITPAVLEMYVSPQPKPDYVPPAPSKPEYIPPTTPKPDYVPPEHPKPDYIAPVPAKPDYVPPTVSLTDTAPSHPQPAPGYKPLVDPQLQTLQDFAHPGSGRPRDSMRPSGDDTTYAPPVYTPMQHGPGYNELAVSSRPSLHRPTRPPPPSYYPHDYYDDEDEEDDDYYYDEDDEDYYYYDEDDEDDYYYYDDDDYYYDDYDYDDYYDDYDYDYAPYRQPLRRPHLLHQQVYNINDNEILDFGYIAGIPGRAGRDYPILSYIPLTSFACDLVADYPGYYADMEAGCQVFHICHHSGRQDSFLCPNGTIFNQKYFVCDWWYNFGCEDAPFFYPVNAAIGHPGVPLHKNIFEPDLRAVHRLPPLHPPQHHPHRVTHGPLYQATPIPAHHMTSASPPLHVSPHLQVTIKPRYGHLLDSHPAMLG